MGQWRHEAWTLADQRRLGDVVMGSFETTRTLNDVGSWSGSIIVGEGATDPTIARSLDRGRTCIVSSRDGRIVDAGIVWGSSYQLGSGQLSLAGAGLLSYLDHRLTGDTGTTLHQTAQNAIVARLLALASEHGVGLDAVSPLGEASRVRDRSWIVQDSKMIGEAIRDLTGVRGGPDVTVDVVGDGEIVRRNVSVWSPRAGRSLSEDESPRFVAGINARDASISTDGTQQAYHVLALGEGIGEEQLYAVREDLERLSSTDTPRLDAVISHESVRVVDTLVEHAEGYLDRHSDEAIESLPVTVDPDHALQPWWSWRLGDDCWLVAADDDPLYGRSADPAGGTVRWPRRIVSESWSISSDGAESLTLTLGKPWEAATE